MVGIINWITNWFASHCDGDWEHENVINIETVNNPGWYITIGLNYTDLDDIVIGPIKSRVSETDWYDYKIEDAKFTAAGDLSKLEFLLTKFKELVESNVKH